MTTPRTVAFFGGGLALLLSLVIVAELVNGMNQTAGEFLSSSWGQVTLTDLYLGLAIIGAWMWRREDRFSVRIAWLVAFALLGNIATGLYLVRAGSERTWEDFFHGAARPS